MVYQQTTSSQYRVPISASPLPLFIAKNRGKPAQYPGSFKLNGKVSTSSSGRNNYEYIYEATCFVDTNVTLHQVHVVGYSANQGDKAEVSIKQDNNNLHTKSYTHSAAELDTFDSEKAVSFDIPGVKIKQGNFVVRYKFRRRNSYSVDSSRHVLTYSPSWQKESDGHVEWWCKSSSTPFYGLQFTTDS